MRVVGVRFRKAGKIYYFEKNGLDFEGSKHVIVETSRGVEYGHIVYSDKEVSDEEVILPLKPVIRLATPEDDMIYQENLKMSREAFVKCKEKIVTHDLQMKLVDAEYTFDRNKLLFYFTSDDRVDFRELVKDLASVFRTRIELRQIGVRDESKMIPSIGGCGRSLCCGTFLSNFHPVSIKMAKDQNLSLSPNKISGICGRLLCCLQYEQSTYEELNKISPREGDLVRTPTGAVGEVQYVNLLRQQVKVVLKDGDDVEILQYSVQELEKLPSGSKEKKQGQTSKEIKKEVSEEALAKLEDTPKLKSGAKKERKKL